MKDKKHAALLHGHPPNSIVVTHIPTNSPPRSSRLNRCCGALGKEIVLIDAVSGAKTLTYAISFVVCFLFLLFIIIGSTGPFFRLLAFKYSPCNCCNITDVSGFYRYKFKEYKSETSLIIWAAAVHLTGSPLF